MSSNYISDRLLAKLLEIVRWFDATIGKLQDESRRDLLCDNFVPFVITAAPEPNGDGVPVAEGMQLFFDDKEGFRLDGSINNVVSEIYFPLSVSPDHSPGDRLFCVWRGRWEAVGSPGGGSSEPKLAGVVMETFGPGEEGRVRIYGRTYADTDGNGDPIEPVYDIILCDELAGAEDEYPEKIPAGTVLADIRGPDTRPKEGGGEGEVEEIYKAVNTKSDHTGILLFDLVGPASSSTIRIRDAKGVLITLTVYAYYLGENQVLPAGTGIMTYRQRTEGGLRLTAVKSRSAITDTTTG